jgi:quinol monooxygenase YgiN
MQPIAAGTFTDRRTLDHPQQETTMPITATLELKHKPVSVPSARDVMRRALHGTRAFDGNLGTDVLVDQDDQAHWIIYQRWETVEHDEAYRSFRAGETQPTELPPLLAAPPVKTRRPTSATAPRPRRPYSGSPSGSDGWTPWSTMPA